ncbi:MAG TPA: RNA polymerase subunit sigma-70, partial [Stenotrophomonas sp.]|nr:RNA polymerase subunit sigma-70 [Stenotrophomonas sp.]
FVHLNTFTAMVVCTSLLVSLMLQVPLWLQLAILVIGLGTVNYQCLVPLQRVMAPMIARDSARRGRSGTNWQYESVYGRTGIIGANVFVIALVVYTLMRSGNV